MFLPPSIETRSLSIGYPIRGGLNRVVHSGLDLQLYAGGVTCLLGRNGSGKSTLLRTLCGLLKPLSGEIILEGRPLETYTPEERASKVGVVLTDRGFPGAITVYELVSMGRYPHTDFFGNLEEEDHAIVRESLEMVGIDAKAAVMKKMEKVSFPEDFLKRWLKTANKELTDEQIEKDCCEGCIGCVACKKRLAEKMVNAMADMHVRRQEYQDKPEKIREILDEGAKKARVIAQKTMEEVREVMHLA